MTISMKTLEKATLEDIFNQVEEHLLQQNKRSTSYGNGCMYRGEGNLKCAVGCLISDEEYSSAIEHTNVDSHIFYKFMTDNGFWESRLDARKMSLLKKLQRIHDTVDPEYWKSDLNQLKLSFF